MTTEIEHGPIELAVAAVELDCPIETIATAWTRLQALKRFAADVQKELEQRCLAYIEAHGGKDIRWSIDDAGGEQVLTTKPEKVIKCRDVAVAIESAIAAAHGDWSKVEACFSSNAIKYGAMRTLLTEAGTPQLFDQIFETTERVKLVEGKPGVRAIDTRYINR